jgi:hypothetical protein
MPLPEIPSVIVKVPGAEATPGTLDAPPSVEVFPVAGPPDVRGLLHIRYDGAEYAPRASVTSSPTRVVVCIGPVPPAIDGTYALDDVDVWWSTA